MIMVKTTVSLFAGTALAFVALSPVHAASPITDAFLANVGVNVGFLDRSSRLALDHSDAWTVRSFARAEAQEAAKVASALGDSVPAERPSKIAAVEGDAILTGRSVAIDERPASEASDLAANGRSPIGQADVAQLEGLKGRAFDNLYWEKQLDALSQLESDYRTYISHGDDPALVALSQRQLPKIMNRLASLTKI